jgi:hypothetical protein
MIRKRSKPIGPVLARLLAGSALSLTLWSGWLGGAYAATFPTSGSMANASNFYGTSSTQGFRQVDPRGTFGEFYSFATTSAEPATAPAALLEANPIATGPLGTAGLNLERIGRGSTRTSTDLTGLLDSTAKLVATLSAGSLNHGYGYSSALTEEGEYSTLLTSKDSAPSPVPLPPAILLLGSALVGLMVARRRRPAPGT